MSKKKPAWRSCCSFEGPRQPFPSSPGIPGRCLSGLLPEASFSSSKAASLRYSPPSADRRQDVHSKLAHASSWTAPAATDGKDQFSILAHEHSFPQSSGELRASWSQIRGSNEAEGVLKVQHGSAKQQDAALLLQQTQRRCSALASENKLLQEQLAAGELELRTAMLAGTDDARPARTPGTPVRERVAELEATLEGKDALIARLESEAASAGQAQEQRLSQLQDSCHNKIQTLRGEHAKQLTALSSSHAAQAASSRASEQVMRLQLVKAEQGLAAAVAAASAARADAAAMHAREQQAKEGAQAQACAAATDAPQGSAAAPGNAAVADSAAQEEAAHAQVSRPDSSKKAQHAEASGGVAGVQVVMVPRPVSPGPSHSRAASAGRRQMPRTRSASARTPDSHQTLVLNGMLSRTGSSIISPGASSSGNSSNASARSQEKVDRREKMQPIKQVERKKAKPSKIEGAARENGAKAAEDAKESADLAQLREKIAELHQTVLEGCLERMRLQRTLSQMVESSAANSQSSALIAQDTPELLASQPSAPSQQFAEVQPRASQDGLLSVGMTAMAGRDVGAQQKEIEGGRSSGASSEMLAAGRQERRSVEDCWMRASSSRQGLGGRGRLRRLSSRTGFGSRKQ